MKQERFDPEKVKLDDCHSLRSMRAICRSGRSCNKMYDLIEKGYVFFFDGNKVEPKFKFGYGDHLSISLVDGNYGIQFVGDTQAYSRSSDKYLPYTTLKEQREFWLRFSYIRPKDLNVFNPF